MIDENTKDAALRAALSGGLSGGLFGAATRIVGGKGPYQLSNLLKAAGIGFGTGASVAGGSTLLGSSLMGYPEPDDPSAYTRRATVGGLVGGGLGGALIGAAASRGIIPLPRRTPDFIKNYFSKLTQSPEFIRSGLKGAGIGAITGGIPSAFLASDEGMQVDFINNELRRKKKEEALRGILGE
jgi:hypothetical protein